jgi:hypothetical protein
VTVKDSRLDDDIERTPGAPSTMASGSSNRAIGVYAQHPDFPGDWPQGAAFMSPVNATPSAGISPDGEHAIIVRYK